MKIDHLEDSVTPPFDVISAEAGVEPLKKNPYSTINLDLRNISEDDLGEDCAFLLCMQDKDYIRAGSLVDRSEVLKCFDVVVLSDMLINEVFGLSSEKCVK